MTTRHPWQDAIEAGDTHQIRTLSREQEIDKVWIHGSAVQWAIFANQPSSVTTLIDLGATVHSDYLMGAVLANTPEIIGILVDRGACVNAQDRHGDSALMKAAREGHADCVAVLLARGANPDLVDDNGQTALHHALIDGDREICMSLATIVDIGTTDKIGWNYLMYAAIQQRTDVCYLLMERGIPLDAKAPDGRSLAQLCAPSALTPLANWQKARDSQEALTRIAGQARPEQPGREPRRKPGL